MSNEWFSVKKRLPENGVHVLVKQKDNKYPYIASWMEDERSDGFLIIAWISYPYDIDYNNDITHWQPLPSSPEEE